MKSAGKLAPGGYAEVWTTPHIAELWLTPDGEFLARLEFDHFLGAEADLIRNIHGVARRAELDGEEVGNLVGGSRRSSGFGDGESQR